MDDLDALNDIESLLAVLEEIVAELRRRDLASDYPALAAEWHPTRNGDLTPQTLDGNWQRIVWWHCPECGHEWEDGITARIHHGKGCCVCALRKSGRMAVAGVNDLATMRPDLAGEWHEDRNGILTPQMVTKGSGLKVWWRCPECGHEWRATVAARSRGSKCPECTALRLGWKPVPGVNDLATLHPDLAAEWHPDKNGDLGPQDVTAGSGRKVWWRCRKCDREWQAAVCSRSRGSGCSRCKSKAAAGSRRSGEDPGDAG